MQSVSVCMATYNGEEFISQQIKSIINQLNNDDELIISDDGSTDGTLKIVAAFNDPRIKIYHNSGPKGPVMNFQNAMLKANGNIIFLADQDDIWFENKISTMKNYLEEYDLVVCDCNIVDNELNIIKPSFFLHHGSGAGFIKNLKRNTYMGNCMAFKKEMLKLALPLPSNIPNHDLWLGVVADLFYRPIFINEVLGQHRRHNNNASNTFDIKIATSFWQKINKRVLVFRALPRLLIRKIM